MTASDEPELSDDAIEWHLRDVAANPDDKWQASTAWAILMAVKAAREQLAQAEVREMKGQQHIDVLRERLNVAEVNAGMHVGTCDWGDCDLPTVTVRMSRTHGRLPVCIFHSEAYEMLATENTGLYANLTALKQRAEAAEANCAALGLIIRRFSEWQTSADWDAAVKDGLELLAAMEANP